MNRVTVRHHVTPERVKWLREQLKAEWGWGVRKMAKELGCDHSLVIRIERGERSISPEFRQRFHELEEAYQLSRADEEQRQSGLVVLVDFELNCKRIRLFENGRWRKE
ncbi:MAG: helix-turn-helix transcriptional regulator [Anaerolineae bacterium]